MLFSLLSSSEPPSSFFPPHRASPLTENAEGGGRKPEFSVSAFNYRTSPVVGEWYVPIRLLLHSEAERRSQKTNTVGGASKAQGFGLSMDQLNSSQIPIKQQRHMCLNQLQSFHIRLERFKPMAESRPK
ncbi:hypothetical protein Q8A73_005404 [Channa argus]|nr:hypothetical protein Q8A73_005404 [Channa argus]